MRALDLNNLTNPEAGVEHKTGHKVITEAAKVGLTRIYLCMKGIEQVLFLLGGEGLG